MKKHFVFPLAFLLLSGCAAVNSASQKGSVTTEVQQQIKTEMFDDVPVYPGFKVIPEKSFVYESGNVKVGRLIFKGKSSINDLVSYYKNTLPEQGWEPISVSIYGKDASLTYVTSDRVLQIRITRGFSETTLIIQMGPRGELTSERK
jgi:hypothetical protein